MADVQEKAESGISGSGSSVSSAIQDTKDWPTQRVLAAEEDLDPALKWTLRKRDLTVLPLLLLGLLVFQLDRMNVASALTGGFAADIGVTQNDINAGNQLMFAGIVLLEIPFNMILQRVGPRLWISFQIFAFGSIATMQVLVKNRSGFLAVRAILGLAEAGYIPGGTYTLSRWYGRHEIGRRTAIFFFGMFAGNALSPLLASGILKLDGHGLRGWQYIFMIEGLFTVTVAVLFLFFLPESPAKPRPLLSPGLIRFSPSEADRLQAMLGEATRPLTPRLVWKTICHYRRWPHFVATFAVFSTWAPLTTYTPSIIKSLGFGTIEANALSAVGGFLSLAVVFFFAWMSDRTNRRGATVLAAQASYLVVLIVARQTQESVDKWSRWGLWTAVNAFAVGYHPIHNAWVQLNCAPEERSIGIAMWVMSAISGLMCGTQYFRAADAPTYHTGLRTMIIMVSIGMAMTLLQIAVYVTSNRRMRGKGELIYVP